MNAISCTTRLKLSTLNSQIKHAERQLRVRQRQVEAASAKLISTVHRQMTAPASLWLAGGSGFIIGELTDSQTATPNESTSTEEESPLTTMLNFVSLLRTALPLVWMLKSLYLADQDSD